MRIPSSLRRLSILISICILSMTFVPPASTHADLLGLLLPSLPPLLPSNPVSGITSPVSGLLPGLGSAPGSGASAALQTLLQSAKTKPETRTVLSDSIRLVSLSSSLSAAPFTVIEPDGSEEGILLSLGKKSDKPVLAVRVFPSLYDWSSYGKVGAWVYADTPVAKGRVKLLLSAGKDPDPDYLLRSFDLPDLKEREWTYVSFDLGNDGGATFPVQSYAVSIGAGNALSLKLLPLQLGPGPLHHLKIESVLKNGKRFVQVAAEDVNGNVLSRAGNLYQGVKKLTFSNDDVSVPVGSDSGVTLRTNFTRGVSDLIDVNASLPRLANADLAVTDGTVGSSFGDVSYNLLSADSSGTASSGGATDASQSTLSVAPDPATVGRPVLVSVLARTSAGLEQAQGGDTVSVTVTGSNPQTLSAASDGDGTYEAVFTPKIAGADTITATINNALVGQDTDGAASDGSYHLNSLADTGGNTSGAGGGDSSGRSHRASFGGGAGIAVASSACAPYLLKYIKRGENNDPAEVLKLQQFLRDHEGMVQVPLSGVYDDATFEAVKTFQAQNVKTVLTPWQTSVPTGYVYLLTVRAINLLQCGQLVSVPSPLATDSCEIFNVPLQPGTAGAAVEATQKFLVAHGFMATPPEWGYYGPKTSAAVSAFQSAYRSEILSPLNLSGPTGRWFGMTMRKANELSCP